MLFNDLLEKLNEKDRNEVIQAVDEAERKKNMDVAVPVIRKFFPEVSESVVSSISKYVNAPSKNALLQENETLKEKLEKNKNNSEETMDKEMFEKGKKDCIDENVDTDMLIENEDYQKGYREGKKVKESTEYEIKKEVSELKEKFNAFLDSYDASGHKVVDDVTIDEIEKHVEIGRRLAEKGAKEVNLEKDHPLLVQAVEKGLKEADVADVNEDIDDDEFEITIEKIREYEEIGRKLGEKGAEEVELDEDNPVFVDAIERGINEWKEENDEADDDDPVDEEKFDKLMKENDCVITSEIVKESNDSEKDIEAFFKELKDVFEDVDKDNQEFVFESFAKLSNMEVIDEKQKMFEESKRVVEEKIEENDKLTKLDKIKLTDAIEKIEFENIEDFNKQIDELVEGYLSEDDDDDDDDDDDSLTESEKFWLNKK